MVRQLLLFCVFFGLVATASFGQQEGKRVYQKDSMASIQYHKQSWVIKDGKLCPVDTIGNRQFHKLCLEIGSAEFEKFTKPEK